MNLIRLFGFLLFLQMTVGPSFIYEPYASEEKKRDELSTEKSSEKEVAHKPGKISKTRHTLKIDSLDLSYTATAGEIIVKQGDNDTTGRIFYISYETDEDKKGHRPVTFVFNGGPGAASVWLHLGGLGPMRINLTGDGRTPPTPVGYSENPYTWLAFTDLVFIDPVGTGFSRTEPDDDKTSRPFYDITGDVRSVADFIRHYLSKNGRWMSPKFLAGESYGTTRAARIGPWLSPLSPLSCWHIL